MIFLVMTMPKLIVIISITRQHYNEIAVFLKTLEGLLVDKVF